MAYEALSGKAYRHPPNEEPPKLYPNMKKKYKIAKKDRLRVEWNMYKTACFTRLGACYAICENICRALFEKCYEQLENELMGYTEVPIFAYFDHLDKRWYRMDTKTRKKMHAEFYEPWDHVMYISKFGKYLIKERKYLKTCGIEINDEAKIQFYIDQMIDSCMFENKDIIKWENWENKTFKEAKAFFEQLVDDDDIYTNVVGGTAKRARFESAKHMRPSL